MQYSRMLGWHGVTSDGRKVTVDPEQVEGNEQDSDLEGTSPDIWAASGSPAVHVFCGICDDDPSLDDSENTGGAPCTCECHEDGIARPARL